MSIRKMYSANKKLNPAHTHAPPRTNLPKVVLPVLFSAWRTLRSHLRRNDDYNLSLLLLLSTTKNPWNWERACCTSTSYLQVQSPILFDISGLYDVKGELGTFLLTFCTALRLYRNSAPPFPLGSEPEEAIACRVDYGLDLSLPEHFGESLRALTVHGDVSERHVDFNSLKFPNLRELKLDANIDAKLVWLLVLGRNIESLYCGGFSYDIAKYCPQLRHLYLFDMHWDDYDMIPWDKVGEKLETLSVYVPLDDIDIIQFVEERFYMIKRLELSGNNHAAREAISKCIATYGNHLERVRLDSLTESQLLRIKSACPKARIELITKKVLLAQSLKIVGGELEEVTVDSGDDSKYRLRSIDLSISGDLKKVKAAVSLIAKGTGGLEEFDLACDNAANGMFKELVVANRSMRKVKIFLRNSGQKNEVAADILKTFLKSPSLRKLAVTDRSYSWGEKNAEIERICRNEGSRRVCISVFGWNYLS